MPGKGSEAGDMAVTVVSVFKDGLHALNAGFVIAVVIPVFAAHNNLVIFIKHFACCTCPRR